MKLYVIYVQYDPAKYGEALDKLKGYLAKIENCQVTYVVVDNAISGNIVEKLTDDTIKIAGDNSIREFSGWQRGLDYVRQNHPDYDVVLLSNEAFETPGKSFLADYAREELLHRCSENNSVIGRIDTYKQ